MTDDAPKLSPACRRVADAIDRGAFRRLPLKTVAGELGISVRTTRWAFHRLRELGVIAYTAYRPRDAYVTPMLSHFVRLTDRRLPLLGGE